MQRSCSVEESPFNCQYLSEKTFIVNSENDRETDGYDAADYMQYVPLVCPMTGKFDEFSAVRSSEH